MATVIVRYYDDRFTECPLLRYVVVLQKVGCDKKENSYAEDDRCGVCGGRGDSCKVMSGTFKKKLPKRGKYRLNCFIYEYPYYDPLFLQ